MDRDQDYRHDYYSDNRRRGDYDRKHLPVTDNLNYRGEHFNADLENTRHLYQDRAMEGSFRFKSPSRPPLQDRYSPHNSRRNDYYHPHADQNYRKDVGNNPPQNFYAQSEPGTSQLPSMAKHMDVPQNDYHQFTHRFAGYHKPEATDSRPFDNPLRQAPYAGSEIIYRQPPQRQDLNQNAPPQTGGPYSRGEPRPLPRVVSDRQLHPSKTPNLQPFEIQRDRDPERSDTKKERVGSAVRQPVDEPLAHSFKPRESDMEDEIEQLKYEISSIDCAIAILRKTKEKLISNLSNLLGPETGEKIVNINSYVL